MVGMLLFIMEGFLLVAVCVSGKESSISPPQVRSNTLRPNVAASNTHRQYCRYADAVADVDARRGRLGSKSSTLAEKEQLMEVRGGVRFPDGPVMVCVGIIDASTLCSQTSLLLYYCDRDA